MNRHSNPEQNETEARDSQNINYGNMPYDSMQEHSMYQGGMQAQMNGRPMICYPMYGNAMHYGSQMGENQGDYQMDMYRQNYGGMHYYHPRPRPYPYYHYYPRPRRPFFMYYNFYPMHPYYPYPYYDEDDEYGY
jgi:hypothetical protein